MIRATLVAALAATSLAAPAWADLTYITCQPDRSIENGKTKSFSDSEKARHVYAYTFAYDLASGKACSIDRTWKMCAPDLWSVALSTDSQTDLFFVKRNSRGATEQTLLYKPENGRFRATSKAATSPPSTTDYVGEPGACKPFADFTVEMPQ